MVVKLSERMKKIFRKTPLRTTWNIFERIMTQEGMHRNKTDKWDYLLEGFRKLVSLMWKGKNVNSNQENNYCKERNNVAWKLTAGLWSRQIPLWTFFVICCLVNSWVLSFRFIICKVEVIAPVFQGFFEE